MSCGNEVRLTGIVKDKEALRYTPAGIPVVRCALAHQSTQTEAGQRTQARCIVPLQAAGDWAGRIASHPEDVELTVTGFLAQAGLRRSDLVLHVTKIE